MNEEKEADDVNVVEEEWAVVVPKEANDAVKKGDRTKKPVRRNDLEEAKKGNQTNGERYYALVIDAGAIIKHSTYGQLHQKANAYYTTPGVVEEVRDQTSREFLSNGVLPFDLQVKEPRPESYRVVAQFAKLTGDYRSLSAVDVQVLALQYELEVEGCGGIVPHVRQTPKRVLGLGVIEPLNPNGAFDATTTQAAPPPSPETNVTDSTVAPGTNAVPTSFAPDAAATSAVPAVLPEKKTWAMMVNPTAASEGTTTVSTAATVPPVMSLGGDHEDESGDSDEESDEFDEEEAEDEDEDNNLEGGCVEGQFSDADDDDEFNDPDEDDSKGIIGALYGLSVSSPEKATAEQEDRQANDGKKQSWLEQELARDFPSLAAASTVPREDEEESDAEHDDRLKKSLEEEFERQKEKSLQPLTRDGRLCNSFRQYRKVMNASGVKVVKSEDESRNNMLSSLSSVQEKEAEDPTPPTDGNKSRILGFGGGMAEAAQDDNVDDDGEGWVTSVRDIHSMKATGSLAPNRKPKRADAGATAPATSAGEGKSSIVEGKTATAPPPLSKRAACATTDFAMQNVILQMNMELVTVDGMKVRKLKSWVTRCSACFTVYTKEQRMFCARCGSDALSRVAASVDGKTGRLRLHLSSKYKHNLRGTKFSLPAPGKNNRFEGDLLLREDQLLYGAWNQKAKKKTSKAQAESAFGSDLASHLGCNVDLTKRQDIRVGFGRKNPNATKFGRERRGKKKKSTGEKACGLRRY